MLKLISPPAASVMIIDRLENPNVPFAVIGERCFYVISVNAPWFHPNQEMGTVTGTQSVFILWTLTLIVIKSMFYWWAEKSQIS